MYCVLSLAWPLELIQPKLMPKRQELGYEGSELKANALTLKPTLSTSITLKLKLKLKVMLRLRL